jgi:hypothetical protein
MLCLYAWGGEVGILGCLVRLYTGRSTLKRQYQFILKQKGIV